MADSIEKQLTEQIDLALKQQTNAEELQRSAQEQARTHGSNAERAKVEAHKLRTALHVMQGKAVDSAVNDANTKRRAELRRS